VVKTALIDQEDWPAIDEWIGDLVDKTKAELLLSNAADERDRDRDYLLDEIAKLDAPQSMTTASLGAKNSNLSSAKPNGSEHMVLYTKERPLMARMVERRALTKMQAVGDKETVHIEFDIEGTGLEYTCGDALGVVPMNSPQLVTELLIAMAANADETVALRGEEMRAEDALLARVDVRNVRPEVLKYVAGIARSKADKTMLDALLEGADSHARSEKSIAFLARRDLLDVLQTFSSAQCELEAILELLKPLLPRYYSISSAPCVCKLNSKRVVSITAAVVRYEAHGRARSGVATTFLADRVSVSPNADDVDDDFGDGANDAGLDRRRSSHMEVSSRVGIFVSRNVDFRLPQSRATPIIMIGPGTGVAPFRAFIAARVGVVVGEPQKEKVGEQWLFFGCRHENRDFLYEEGGASEV